MFLSESQQCDVYMDEWQCVESKRNFVLQQRAASLRASVRVKETESVSVLILLIDT